MKSRLDLTKKALRSKILLKLKKQEEKERERKSRIIKNKLFRTAAFKKAKRVMFYIALDDEVNTEDMIKEAKMIGKMPIVPVCKKDRMNLRPCILDDHASLKRGPYGVHEPVRKKHVALDDLDLVLVPGLAFDKKGRRLGRGKGCYDRFLRQLSPDVTSIGMAFDFQILPSVPVSAYDVSVKKIISN